MRAAFFLALIAAAACSSGMLVESCGAMAFELPPEEPLAEAATPPRLVRREAGPTPASSDPQ
ncbi:MAG TPA: hypothetical protein VGL13_02025 [Polyangiaceae bacterium]